MKKPKCRYTGKECPEKPYYIRQEYPFGTPIGYNEDGCMHWHIEIMLNLETKKDLEIIYCYKKDDIYKYFKDSFFVKKQYDEIDTNKEIKKLLKKIIKEKEKIETTIISNESIEVDLNEET
ncbi:MAG: hypothetical protein ACFFG0_04580 [Candidatus Thorarchaeota archaeon]